MRKIISALSLLFANVSSQSVANVSVDQKHLACLLWRYANDNDLVAGSQKFIGIHITTTQMPQKNGIKVVEIDDPNKIWSVDADYFTLSDPDGHKFAAYSKNSDGFKYSFVVKFVGENTTKYSEDWSGSAIRYSDGMDLDKGYGYNGNCVLIASNDGYEYLKKMFLSKEAVK